MMKDLITNETFLENVECQTWEELVELGGTPLVERGYVLPEYLDSIKEAVREFGAYMVVVDDLAFFHGRPEAGVKQLAMSMAMLKEPVFLNGKRIKAALVFAATDNSSHLELMRELGGFLLDEEFLTLIRNHGSKEAIIKKIQEGAVWE